MSANVIKLQHTGTPRTLMENAAEIAHDMKYALMVFVRKDGTIGTEWSHIPDNLAALGAIEVLRSEFLSNAL
jgi:hypothetical protein